MAPAPTVAAPTNLAIVFVNPGYVLEWDPVSGATLYKPYWDDPPVFHSPFDKNNFDGNWTIGGTPEGARLRTFLNPPTDGQKFFITALNAGGESSESNVAQWVDPPGPSIFSDGFESGDLTAWEDPTGNIVASQDFAQAGSWSAKLSYPSDNIDGRVTKTGISDTHIFLRQYERFETNYTFPEDQKINRLFDGDPAKMIIGGNIRFDGTQIKIEVDITDGTSPSETISQASHTFVVDRWYCIETEIQLNTPAASGPWDGIWRVWIDGVLKIEKTDVNLRGNLSNAKITKFWVGGPWSNLGVNPPQTAIRYIDAVVYSTTRIGCGV